MHIESATRLFTFDSYFTYNYSSHYLYICCLPYCNRCAECTKR